MEREKDFLISHLDRDRLDMTDFLKNLKQCDSDNLPQAKLFMGEPDDENSLPDIRPPRDTHTAKTAPPRLRGRRARDVDDDDDDEDMMSLESHHPRRAIATAAESRRQMLSRRRQEEERMKVSDYERAEDFLGKLREEAAKDKLGRDRVQPHAPRVHRLPPAEDPHGRLHRREGDLEDDDSDGELQQDGTWAKARMDLVYPIKRLGDIASRFQKRDSSRDLNRKSADGKNKARRSSPVKTANTDGSELVADDRTGKFKGSGGGSGGGGAGAKNRQPLNPFSRSGIAERRRAQARGPAKQNLRSMLAQRQAPTKADDPKGTDMMRALLQMKSRFRAKPLDDRVKEFIKELKELTDVDKEKFEVEDE
nr:hypothetical protein BaRGS_033201 [Batillaria attramentaria]